MKRLKKQQKSSMNIIYTGENLPNEINKSIFLAGPMPRSSNIKSWRKDAIDIFEQLNYDGTLFIPEPKDGKTYPDYSEQISWEDKMLNVCDIIIFWIPRQLRNDFEMLALTTNIELGKWYKSGKVIVGYPKDAEHVRYITEMIKEEKLIPYDNLKELIKNAISIIGEGSYREDGECLIPLNIWETDSFQNWWKNQKSNGNKILDSKFQYLYKPLPKKDFVFFWVLYLQIYVKSEDRIKGNELVIARPDISSIMLYLPDENIMNTKVVLVKEFRDPANNKESFVYELPGGSAKTTSDPIKVAQAEIKEETNLDIEKNRINYEQSRQLMATMSCHRSHLFSVKLNKDDIPIIEEQMKTTHGVEEDTEKTYIIIKTVKEILDEELLDWSNIGMILSVLNKEENNE